MTIHQTLPMSLVRAIDTMMSDAESTSRQRFQFEVVVNLILEVPHTALG